MNDFDLPLGAEVAIKAIVIGQSRFQVGENSYLVEFTRKGKTVREWWSREDLIANPKQQVAA